MWAIAPCYFLACPIFEDAGFKGRLRAVPEDEDGVDIAWLERGLREFGDRGGGEKPVGVFLFCLCCTISYDGGRSSGLVVIHDELLVFDPARSGCVYAVLGRGFSGLLTKAHLHFLIFYSIQPLFQKNYTSHP